MSTGGEAEAYASYIGGHLEGIADGATYAELGGPEREAKAASRPMNEGQSESAVAELQANADALTNQRNSLFKGETLRGCCSRLAWSTIGRIAGIAAIVAPVGAAAMAALVVLGMSHRHRTT